MGEGCRERSASTSRHVMADAADGVSLSALSAISTWACDNIARRTLHTRQNGRGRGLRTVQRLGDLCFHHRNLRSNGERLKFSFRSIRRACPLRYFEKSFIHAQAWLFVPEVRRRKCRRLVDGSKLCICPSSFEYRLSWRRKRVPSDRRQKGLPRQASTTPASGRSAAERRHVVRQIEFKVVPGHLTRLRIYVRSLHFHTKTARTQAHLHRTHFLATSCHIAIIVARNFDALFLLSSSGLAHLDMRVTPSKNVIKS
jgi:hypothetical protein